jgi:hypothetical protein
MKSLAIPLGSILLIGVLAFFAFYQPTEVQGGAFTGSAAKQSFATTTQVGPQSKVTIFAAQPSCTSRTIALSDGTGVGIRFLTGDPAGGNLSSTTLTNVVGLNQSGSTTVTYDGGLNGCGRWIAIASASTTVTLVEYQ